MGAGIVCFILCFGSTGGLTPPVETYCTNYNRVVVSRADRNAIRNLPRHLRRRLQANELDYLRNCRGWKGKVKVLK